MKNYITSNFIKSVAVTVLMGASAALSYAGPDLGSGNRTRPVTTVDDAKAVKRDDTVVMVCGACRTVAVLDAVYGYFPGGEIDNYRYQWIAVGSKHQCEHCGGEITVVRGKTTDSMQHNCSKCGEGAAFCCAVTPDAGIK
jgi:hypothetical protein